MKQRLMWIAWPSFLVAAILELIVFSFVDPQDMHWLSSTEEISRQAAYTVAFFVFWACTARGPAETKREAAARASRCLFIADSFQGDRSER